MGSSALNSRSWLTIGLHHCFMRRTSERKPLLITLSVKHVQCAHETFTTGRQCKRRRMFYLRMNLLSLGIVNLQHLYLQAVVARIQPFSSPIGIMNMNPSYFDDKDCRYTVSGDTWIGPGGNMTCTLLKEVSRVWGRRLRGKGWAAITVTIVYQKEW